MFVIFAKINKCGLQCPGFLASLRIVSRGTSTFFWRALLLIDFQEMRRGDGENTRKDPAKAVSEKG